MSEVTLWFDKFEDSRTAFSALTATVSDIQRSNQAHGTESVTLADGTKIRFRTKTAHNAKPKCSCSA